MFKKEINLQLLAKDIFGMNKKGKENNILIKQFSIMF